jgi:hypothetical protein
MLTADPIPPPGLFRRYRYQLFLLTCLCVTVALGASFASLREGNDRLVAVLLTCVIIFFTACASTSLWCEPVSVQLTMVLRPLTRSSLLSALAVFPLEAMARSVHVGAHDPVVVVLLFASRLHRQLSRNFVQHLAIRTHDLGDSSRPVSSSSWPAAFPCQRRCQYLLH